MTHTLVHHIEHWAERTPQRNALHGKRDGRWYAVSWAEYWDNVRALAKAFLRAGHQSGECIAFVGANDPRWVQYQFAAQAISGIPAPIYLTNTKEQSAYIVKNAEARILVVDGAEQLDKLLVAEQEGLFPKLEAIFTFDALPHAKTDPRIRSFDEAVLLGEAEEDAAFRARYDAIDPETTCMLIYTSGTTGVPKGVQLDHRGQLLIGEAIRAFRPQMMEAGRYHVISYLPLCHQAEQLFTNVFSLMTGGEVYFCPDLNQIRDYLVDVRPTVFLGVPRVWEKFESALRARIGQATGIKAKLAAWAMSTERKAFEKQLARGGDEYMPVARKLARKLVVNKVKEALGLDRLEVAITGSAPISPSTQTFFSELGITIYEGYGLSETSGACTITDAKRPRFGTVGRALAGSEIRLSDEGEVQVKGALNTKGYFKMPEETAALYTDDGWLKTGDLGAFDAEGNLSITGRIKELLITAGGKNVAPVELENHIKAIPGVGHVVVVGDRQPYLSALITLNPEATQELSKLAGVPNGSIAELAKQQKVRAYLEQRIEQDCNAKVARYQTIKKIELLPHELTVDGGELTATMKLKRKFIADKYAPVIAAFYQDKDSKKS